MSQEAEAAAIAVANAFNDTFNSQDNVAQADTLNYPHVRLWDGKFTTFHSADDFFKRCKVIKKGLDAEKWHHTTNSAIAVIHSGDDKVHLTLQQDRCHENGEVYQRFDTLWIVTLLDGHWGVQFRSSFLQ